MPGATAGIRVAFNDVAFTTSEPTWTQLDGPTGSSYVSGWTIDRGRTYELDKTQAGTSTFTLIDTTGRFDPTNPSSPYFGQIGPMRQMKIGLVNPVNHQNYDLFTGYIEAWNYTMDTAEKMMTIDVDAVDGFEPLSRAEFPPDSTGTTVLTATTDVQTRIHYILDTFFGWNGVSALGWPTYLRKINSGNVLVKQTIYNPGTSLMSGLQDAADAEFPGVANIFMNKIGQVTFYGRYPRFQPTSYPQDVTFWTVGDKNAVNTFGGAPIHDIQWNLDQKNLINAAQAWPEGLAQNAIASQLYVSPSSIANYGNRLQTMPNLQTDGSSGSATPPSLTPAQECQLFSWYYAANYNKPVQRISKLEFVTQDPATTTGAALWNFICGVEIGDILTVYSSNPGGGGFSKETDASPFGVDEFFVEGIHYSAAPMTANFPQITVNLDVSPRAWFNQFPSVFPPPVIA